MYNFSRLDPKCMYGTRNYYQLDAKCIARPNKGKLALERCVRQSACFIRLGPKYIASEPNNTE